MNDEQQTAHPDPLALEELAVEKLKAAWEYAGMPIPSAYPVGTGDVLRLADKLGYRVDFDFITGLMDRGRLRVDLIDGRPQWSALAVVNLTIECEARRRWQLHPHHMGKLTHLESLQLRAEAAGEPSIFHDHDLYDNEQLLLLMEAADNPADRHTLRVVLMTRLHAQGAL